MHMDEDGDGLVGQLEYERHAWRAQEFQVVDADRNQTLSVEELRSLLRTEDVQRFDDRTERRAVDPDVWARPFADPSDERLIWELLCFLDAELRAADENYRSPPHEDMVRAARTAALESTEVSTLLMYFQAAYDAQGWMMPEHLMVEVGGG